jgi:hypothetical protein
MAPNPAPCGGRGGTDIVGTAGKEVGAGKQVGGGAGTGGDGAAGVGGGDGAVAGGTVLSPNRLQPRPFLQLPDERRPELPIGTISIA